MASIILPAAVFLIDSGTPIHEDEYGVDHYEMPHYMLLHMTLLLVGAACGAYAAVRRSKLWWLAVLLNLALMAFFGAGGNNF